MDTVLPRLVRMRLVCMRTIKLMCFSGFVLTERAYYSAVHFFDPFVRSIFLNVLFKKTYDLEHSLEFLDIFEQGNLDLE